MLTETSITGSDDWWLMRLATEMGQTFPRLGKLRQYRDGNAPVPVEASAAMREAYAKWAKQGRLVMTDLIVSAKVDRQKPLGFRTASATDDIGDKDAWRIWRSSNMGVKVRDFLTDVGHYGSAFLQVTGSATAGTGRFANTFAEPLIVPSDGWSTYTVQNATRPWLADAGLTIGYDPVLMADTLVLHLPGYRRVAVRPGAKSAIPDDGSAWTPGNGWVWTGPPQPYGYTNDVAIIRQDAKDSVGYYEKHLDTIDRINETIKQISTLIAMQAFRQRAIKGNLPQVYPADHDLAGQVIDYNEIFKAGPAALWLIPDEAEVWESTPVDVTPIRSVKKEDVEHLAAVTATPLYTLSPDAASGSAQGASLTRESNAFSVEDANDRADAAFALTMGLAFASKRDVARADPSAIETIWASIDRASIIERAQVAPQAKAGGLPQRMIDQKVFGMTPSEVEQAAQDRINEEFNTPTDQSPLDAVPHKEDSTDDDTPDSGLEEL